jgi:hypothetical protein
MFSKIDWLLNKKVSMKAFCCAAGRKCFGTKTTHPFKKEISNKVLSGQNTPFCVRAGKNAWVNIDVISKEKNSGCFV